MMDVCDITPWQVTLHFKHHISKKLFDASSRNSASITITICKIQRTNNGMIKGLWHTPHFEAQTFHFGVYQCYHHATWWQ